MEHRQGLWQPILPAALVQGTASITVSCASRWVTSASAETLT